MALQITNKRQLDKVLSIIGVSVDSPNVVFPLSALQHDDVITFDQMAEIVDYLRNQEPMKDLFEKCWVAYRRKGSKKKSLEYWRKLSDNEREQVLPHVKAYTTARDIQYQKDFERYLRDKVFTTVVYQNNTVIYDPSRVDGTDANRVYMPSVGGLLSWNEYYKKYIYVGYYTGYIADGYTDETRPDRAEILLNNGRGTIMWNATNKRWEKE